MNVLYLLWYRQWWARMMRPAGGFSLFSCRRGLYNFEGRTMSLRPLDVRTKNCNAVHVLCCGPITHSEKSRTRSRAWKMSDDFMDRWHPPLALPAQQVIPLPVFRPIWRHGYPGLLVERWVTGSWKAWYKPCPRPLNVPENGKS